MIAASSAAVSAPDPACLVCGRLQSRHDEPLIIDGEQITPACALLHPGGVYSRRAPAGDPPTLSIRPLAKRLAIARGMSIELAKKLAGGPLGHPSKLPGRSYGLDAWRCHTGAMLVNDPESVCFGCYAMRDFYATWWPVKLARDRRHDALDGRFWVEALIRLILAATEDDGVPFFRGHDSGDLQSWQHLARIAAVCEATPAVKHWLPTREYAYVATFLARGGSIPSNLVIRLSARTVGDVPRLPFGKLLVGLPTSTVHDGHGAPVAVSDRRRDSIECRAYTRDNRCGSCRACWTPGVRNVSYPRH